MVDQVLSSLRLASSIDEVEDGLDKLYTMIIEKTISIPDFLDHIFSITTAVEMLPWLGLDVFGDILGIILAGDAGLARLTVPPISNLVDAVVLDNSGVWAESERGLVRMLSHLQRLVAVEDEGVLQWISQLVFHLGDRGVAGAEKVATILTETARFHAGLEAVVAESNQLEKFLREGSSVVQTRVLDVLTRILVINDAAYALIASHGWLDQFRDGISGDGNDVLLQIALIQMAANMVSLPLGFKYLSESGIIRSICVLLSDFSTMSFIRVAALDVIGNSGEYIKILIKDNPDIIKTVVNSLKTDGNVTEKALMVVGDVAQCESGFDELARLNAWQILIQYVKLFNVAALHAFAHVLECKVRSTEQLFHDAGGVRLKDGIESHDELVRRASIHVLQSVCSSDYGRKAIVGDGDLMKWMLMRDEVSKAEREWKYGLVEALYGDGGDILGTYANPLRVYVAQGPHYVDPLEPGVDVKTV